MSTVQGQFDTWIFGNVAVDIFIEQLLKKWDQQDIYNEISHGLRGVKCLEYQRMFAYVCCFPRKNHPHFVECVWPIRWGQDHLRNWWIVLGVILQLGDLLCSGTLLQRACSHERNDSWGVSVLPRFVLAPGHFFSLWLGMVLASCLHRVACFFVFLGLGSRAYLMASLQTVTLVLFIAWVLGLLGWFELRPWCWRSGRCEHRSQEHRLHWDPRFPACA